MIRRFLEANRRASAAVDERLADRALDLYRRYDAVVAERFPREPAAVAADVGGGRTCSFAGLIPPRPRARLVAVDVSGNELALNRDADEARVADITRGLPFDDDEVRLLTSRAVMEHLPDVDGFLAHSYRVLEPGGQVVHLFPGRHALFALVARHVPFEAAKALLHRLYPPTRGVVEFPVFYDRCHPSAFEGALRRRGFVDVETQLSFNQTDYVSAFFPAYLACALYEAVVRRLCLRDLAAYVLVVARKPRAGRSPA